MAQSKRALVVITAMQSELDEAIRMDAVDALEGRKDSLPEVIVALKAGNRALRNVGIARAHIEQMEKSPISRD